MTTFFLVLPPQIQSLLQTFEEPWTGGKARFYWKTLESSPLGFCVLVCELRSWLYWLWEAPLKRLLCPPDQNVPARGPRFQLPNLRLQRGCGRLRVHGWELHCSLRDTGLVLFVAGHSCTHTVQFEGTHYFGCKHHILNVAVAFWRHGKFWSCFHSYFQGSFLFSQSVHH